MRKILLAGVAMVVATGTAMATSTNQVVVTAFNAPTCGVVAVDDPNDVSLSNTSTAQPIGTFTYTCNNAAGFTRTVHSAHGGKLVNGAGGAGNEVPYQFSHDASSNVAGLQVNPVSLASDYTDTFGSAIALAFVDGESAGASVTIGTTGPLFSGTFSDTVTVTIAP